MRFEPVKSGTLFGGFEEEDHIYTVAGNGTTGFSGDSLPATGTELSTPTSLALDPQGGMAVSDFFNNRIRFLPSATATVFGQAMAGGDMYTIAGDGTGTFGGEGALGTSAQLSEPNGVAFDQHGDLVIGDRFNSRVRFMPASSGTFFGQAMTAAHIYTIAGNGTAGFAGDGGLATSAELRDPAGVAIDAAGDVVIADANNNRVRFIAATSGGFFGQAMTAGHIYTIAGTGIAGLTGTAAQRRAPSCRGLGMWRSMQPATSRSATPPTIAFASCR